MTAGPPEAQLAEWLRAPDDTLRRLEVRYVRRRSFRWLVLLELLVGLALLMFCLVVLLVGAVLVLLISGSDLDLGHSLPELSPRFFSYRQDVVFQGLDADGASLFRVVHQPRDLVERDALVASVLAAASKAALVVEEAMGDDISEPLETWYGGQPLLAHPEQRDLAASLSVLEQWDWEVEQRDDHLQMWRTEPSVSRFWGAVDLVTSTLFLPLALFGLSGWMASFRRAWANVRGVAPARWEVSITGDALKVCWRRGERVEGQVVMHPSDVLGVAFSPTLGFDREVKRQRAMLTLVARDELVRSTIPLEPREGRALRDAILGAAVSSWAGLPTTMVRPGRCPYCGGLYVFSPTSGCPSCGAWPTATHVNA